MDTLVKLLFVALAAPFWLPVLRSLRDQMKAVMESDDGPRTPRGSWKSGPVRPALPTYNEDLVEVRLANKGPKEWGFRREGPALKVASGPKPAGPPSPLRRVS